MIFSIEEENAVFCDDADDHDHPHERSDVERGSGDEKGEEATERGEDGGGKNGGWRREGAEFEEQDGKKQEQREEKNFEKFAEGFLLLLILAAVLDSNRGGQVKAIDCF